MAKHPMIILQRLRAAKGIFLHEVSTRLGVRPSTVSAWDHGYERIPDKYRQALREVMRLTPMEDYWIEQAELAPLVDRAAATAEMHRAIAEGLAFVSYVHQDGNPECPCNECRFTRSEA